MLPMLRRIHRWIGLLIALPIALQGLSGCILTLADLVPDRQATLAPPRPVGEIVAAAQSRMGDGAHATRYFAPPAIGYAARVQVAATNLPPHELLIDPSSLAVLAVDPFGGRMLGWVRALHVQLLAPAYGGRSVVGWFGIGLLAMLTTAIPIWWPRAGRVRQAFAADFRARGVLFHRRLHGAAGAWIAAVLVVMAISGIVMAFPRPARLVLGLDSLAAPRAHHAAEAAAPAAAAATPAAPAAADINRAVAANINRAVVADINRAVAADINRAVARAQQGYPRLVLRTAFLPARRTDPVRLVLTERDATGAVNAVQLQVGLADGRMRVLDDPATGGPGENLYRWMHDLHTGSGMGAVWRLVQAAGGLALPLLAVTGSMQWWRKRSARRRLAGARRDAIDRLQPDAAVPAISRHAVPAISQHAVPAMQPAAK
jgi:uncharacterized iron-regulated membrane protein